MENLAAHEKLPPRETEGRAVAQLKKATDLEIVHALSNSPILYEEPGGNTVFLLESTFAVKRGFCLLAEAARTYEIWAYRDERIRVPQIYRSFEVGGTGYIVMQYIEGECLGHIPWKDRNKEDKHTILKAVATICLALAKHASTRPGPVKGPPTGRIFSPYGAVHDFPTSTALQEWIQKKLAYHSSPVQFIWPLKDLTICHMDLCTRNIIRDKAGQFWIIDWACAGYYPQEFEIASLHNNQTDGDFPSELSRELEICTSLDKDFITLLEQVSEVNQGRFGGSHLIED